MFRRNKPMARHGKVDYQHRLIMVQSVTGMELLKGKFTMPPIFAYASFLSVINCRSNGARFNKLRSVFPEGTCFSLKTMLHMIRSLTQPPVLEARVMIFLAYPLPEVSV